MNDINPDLIFTNEEYEEMAVESIRTYLNKNFTDDYIRKRFRFAIKKMTIKAKNIEEGKPVGVKSISEGDSSITFDNQLDSFVVDAEIKALLPAPYIKMFWGGMSC